MGKTVCFTGHRIIPAKDRERIESDLYKKIRSAIESDYDTFLCGGALGFDTLAAKTVLDLKHIYPDIKLGLILPCPEQSERWSEYNKKIYDMILARSDFHEYVSESYNMGCMHKRNRTLVDRSDYLIAYKTHEGGGSAYTVSYAYDKGIAIDIIR